MTNFNRYYKKNDPQKIIHIVKIQNFLFSIFLFETLVS